MNSSQEQSIWNLDIVTELSMSHKLLINQLRPSWLSALNIFKI